MDNQNDNNNDFYYGNDDVNASDNAPDLAEAQADSQTSQETQESNPEPSQEPAAEPSQEPWTTANSFNGQPIYNGQPYNPYGMPNEAPKKNTCGIISLILGILSVVLACCCYYLAIPLGVASVILGIVSLNKKESTKGFAIAGIILGCVGLIFAVVTVLSAIYMQKTGIYDEIMRQYMDALGIDSY